MCINLSEMGLTWVRKDYEVFSVWRRAGLVVAYLRISTRGVSEDCRSQRMQISKQLKIWCLINYAHQKYCGNHDMLVDLADVVFMEENG